MADTIIKTFQYKIRKNRKFEEAAQKALDDSRFVYNCALEQRILRYKQGKPIYFLEQSRELTEVRKELPEVGNCLREIQSDSLQRLDFAFSKFFKGCSGGEKAGFPKFKKEKEYNTFSEKVERIRRCPLIGDNLTVPGVGTVRIRLSRPIEGTVIQIRVTRKSSGWFVSLICKTVRPNPEKKTGGTVGIDLGLIDFAVLSTGERIPNPEFLKRAEPRLNFLRHRVDKAKVNSKNRYERRMRMDRKSLYVKNARLDFHHKLAKSIINRFDTIRIEDLQVQQMLKTKYLTKRIADAGWSQFACILESKAFRSGRDFARVKAHFTSQICSECGERQKLYPSQRTFKCVACGHTLNRDLNAAINIGRGTPKSKPAESPKGRRGNRNGKIVGADVKRYRLEDNSRLISQPTFLQKKYRQNLIRENIPERKISDAQT